MLVKVVVRLVLLQLLLLVAVVVAAVQTDQIYLQVAQVVRGA
jgi:hypothetical protein